MNNREPLRGIGLQKGRRGEALLDEDELPCEVELSAGET